MATKIVTKNSSTASAVPTASDLVQGELAVNVADKRLFTEDNAGAIVELGTNPYNFTANHNGSAKLATTSTGIDVTGTATMDGLSVDNITIDGSTITSSGSLTLDLVGNLTIDVDGTVVSLSDAGVNFGQLFNSGSGNFNIYSPVSNQDMIFRGNDGGSGITALTLDMSEAGAATFNSSVTTTLLNIIGDSKLGQDFAYFKSNSASNASLTLRKDSIGADSIDYLQLRNDGNGLLGKITGAGVIHTKGADLDGAVTINEAGADADFRVESDGNANMLFVDGGLNIVSVGSSSVYQSGALEVFAQSDTSSQGVSINGASSATSFRLYTVNNLAKIGRGGDNPAISISSGNAVTINEDSLDADFRVESDAKTHALFVDASSNYVMIGNTASTTGEDFLRLDANAGASGHVIITGRDDTSTKNHIVFVNPNGAVGSIQTAGSATAFNTSSDQRLKENIADADDSGELIDAMQVRKFDWKADGEHQRYGMVAQELQTVAPEAVSAPENPDEMMGVDYSKLVPMLIKEIQSLRNRVAQLEE